MKICRKYKIPNIAGYSKDGKTCYIDSRLPSSFKMPCGRIVEVDQLILEHEKWEKWFSEKFSYGYNVSHQLATEQERQFALERNIPWQPYQDFIMEWNDKLSQEGGFNVPEDYDTYPEMTGGNYASLFEIMREHHG